MFKALRVPVILYAYLRMRLLEKRLNTRARLEKWQNAQLRRHLGFLRANSSYFDVRLPDSEPRSWQALGTIGKNEMMENFDVMNTRGITRERALAVAVEAERSRDFSPTIGGVTVGLSSGTSGHRGVFMASPLEQWMYAGTALAKILPGFWRRKNRVAFFLRANNNLYTAVRSRRLRFEYFDLLEPVQAHIARLNQVQPTLLIAPPSLLRQLAEKLKQGELSIRPGKIISVAEVLDPLDEKFIADAFGRRIHQVYQATEGFLAVTCREGTLHLNEDLMIVEKDWLDRTQGKFQPVITDFSRKTQPIVRYKLNDILTLRAQPCPCGSPKTALDFVEGRSDDLFHLPAANGMGTITIYPDFIRRTMLFASEQIRDYRVVQTGPADLRVELNCGGADAPVRLAVQKEFAALMSTLGCRLDKVEFVTLSTLSTLSYGRKLRRVVNEYATPRAH